MIELVVTKFRQDRDEREDKGEAEKGEEERELGGENIQDTCDCPNFVEANKPSPFWTL